MAQQAEFTNDELLQIANDAQVTPEDLAKLSAGERQRLQQIQASHSTVGRGKDVVTGVLKGVGDDAISLGNAVHSTPLLGQLTDQLAKLVGPAGTDPSTAFAGADRAMDATTTAQMVGKTAQQIGDFFIPAKPARLSAIKSLVGLIPDTASPAAMRLANRVLAIAGRALGEAGSAAGVSAVHGDPNPETEGAIAGAGPLLGELAAQVPRLLRTSAGREIAPLLAAVATMRGFGSVLTPESFMGTMGMFGLAKKGARAALTNPRAIPTMQAAGRGLTTGAARAAAAGVDQSRALQRRRLEP